MYELYAKTLEQALFDLQVIGHDRKRQWLNSVCAIVSSLSERASTLLSGSIYGKLPLLIENSTIMANNLCSSQIDKHSPVSNGLSLLCIRAGLGNCRKRVSGEKMALHGLSVVPRDHKRILKHWSIVSLLALMSLWNTSKNLESIVVRNETGQS